MRRRKHALGIPIHPLLVHFPIGSWFLVLGMDLAAIFSGPAFWWPVALVTTGFGVAVGVLAIITGLLEYTRPSLAGIDMRLAARHGVRTTLAWCTFTAKLIAAALLPFTMTLMILCLLLDLLGCGFLAQGVYFGTRQVYEPLEKD